MSFFEPTWITSLAFWSALSTLAVSGILVFAVVFIRVRLLRKQRRLMDLYNRWRPIFNECVEGRLAGFPIPERWELPLILELWIAVQHETTGPSRERMNDLARNVGLDKAAMSWLKAAGFRKRLLAVVAMGYLRQRAAWHALVKMAAEEDPLRSLMAAWSLVQIDAGRSVNYLVPLIALRDDWSHVRVTSTLKEAGVDLFERPLSDAILSAPAGSLPRLIRIMVGLLPDATPPVVRMLLQTRPDPEVAGACLSALQHPEDAALARGFLQNPEWHVRVQAASALGRVGSPDDIPKLAPLLTDTEWWVRYRAAQAIASLIKSDQEKLRKLEQEQTAPEARSVLAQVISERRAT